MEPKHEEDIVYSSKMCHEVTFSGGNFDGLLKGEIIKLVGYGGLVGNTICLKLPFGLAWSGLA